MNPKNKLARLAKINKQLEKGLINFETWQEIRLSIIFQSENTH